MKWIRKWKIKIVSLEHLPKTYQTFNIKSEFLLTYLKQPMLFKNFILQ